LPNPSGAFHQATSLGVLEEDAGALEFTRARALREISGYGDDVVVTFGDDRLDGLILRGDGRMAEVQIRTMEERRR
jgi:hypothetical protein